MPCHAAMIDKFVTIDEGETIENAIKFLKKSKLDALPVIDENGALSGLFSFGILFENILPVNINDVTGAASSVTISAAPGIAKRLKNIALQPVSQVMERDINIVFPETPTWEAVKFYLDKGGPLFVVDRDSRKPLGLMTEQSMLEEFERMQE